MTLLCDYAGNCEWRRDNGSCGAYCPHKDERRLWTRAAWEEEKRRRTRAAQKAREDAEALRAARVLAEENAGLQADADGILKMIGGQRDADSD